MKKNMKFDSRWLSSGGIGRFCQEIMQSDIIKNSEHLKGKLSEALSLEDVFALSAVTLKGNYFISPGYNGPILGTKRAIITVHDLMHIRFPEYQSFKNKLYYQWIVKRIVRHSPLVFTVSNFTKSEICQWAKLPQDKVVVISNGIDNQNFNVHVQPIVQPRPYFFYVGNHKPHKNLVRLIKAYYLSGLYRHCDLVFSCGRNDELAKLVSELKIVPYVQFLEGIDEKELPRYYKGAIATVVVSLYEGFCLPIVESMAVGTPVLTSNVTAMPETAGGAALLVDPYSITDISSKLKAIYTDLSLREKLIKSGFKRADDFSWDQTREVFNKTLQEYIGG